MRRDMRCSNASLSVAAAQAMSLVLAKHENIIIALFKITRGCLSVSAAMALLRLWLLIINDGA